MTTAEAGIRFIEWMNLHETELRTHAGQWVALRLPEGIIASSPALEEVRRAFETKFPGETPFFHKIPPEDEDLYIL